jgi:hypothetical protein
MAGFDAPRLNLRSPRLGQNPLILSARQGRLQQWISCIDLSLICSIPLSASPNACAVPLRFSSFQRLIWFSSLERQRIRMRLCVATLYVYLRLYRQGENAQTVGVQSQRQWQKGCPVCSSAQCIRGQAPAPVTYSFYILRDASALGPNSHHYT